jgi:nucleoside-diphosphate-sugar epimerase
MEIEIKHALVTGAAGFIGFHLSRRLLSDGVKVTGIDDLNSYYDVKLKEDRLEILQAEPNFSFHKSNIADRKRLDDIFDGRPFDVVVNLAAQAGVRYSLQNPNAYVDANLVGFVNLLECCRYHKTPHLVFASSSSVYGANTNMPFSVHDNVDHPVSLYAATKKSNELLAHSYSHLFDLPCTGLRFFTVYGPWGRPDMGAVFVHQGHLRQQTDPGVQPRQDEARLHLYRRYRRRGRAGHGPAAAAEPGLERQPAGSRDLLHGLQNLQHRQQPAGGTDGFYCGHRGCGR